MKKDGQGFAQWLAGILPNKVVYYVLIRGLANATTGKYGSTVVPDLHADEMIRRWGVNKK